MVSISLVRPGLIPALHCGPGTEGTGGTTKEVRPGLIPALHCGDQPVSDPGRVVEGSAGINPGPPLRRVWFISHAARR